MTPPAPSQRALLLAGALLLGTFPAAAIGDVDVEVAFGHGGRWVVGSPTPAAVTLSNSGDEPVEVEILLEQASLLEAGDLRHERRVLLGVGGVRREVFFLPGPAGYGAGLRLDLSTDPPVTIHHGRDTRDRGVLSVLVRSEDFGTAQAVDPWARAVGLTGSRAAILASRLPEDLADARDLGIDAGPLELRTLLVNEADLAYAPLALEGLDVLLVCDPDGSFAAEPEVLDGLLDWVALGGHLCISPGDRAAEFATSPLAAHLPATWSGTTRQRYDSLADLVARPDPTRRRDAPVPAEGPVLGLRPSPAFPDAAHGPWRSTRRMGSGNISLLSFDARTMVRCMADIEDLRALARGLLVPALDLPPSRTEGEMFGRTPGVEEALVAAIQGGAFNPPPLPCVLLGLALYVLLVGPVDWLVLKRLKRERFTTLTFAATVVLFTVVAYGSTLFLFSAGERVNRITLVDLADGGRGGREVARIQDITGYYRSTGGDLDLSYPMPTVIVDSSVPGVGVAGDMGRSMTATVRGLPLAPRARVEVAIRSQRVVRTLAAGPVGRTVDVVREGDGFRVVNGLPVDLDDAYLLDGDRWWRVGEVPAGGEATATPGGAGRPGSRWGPMDLSIDRNPSRTEVMEFLGFLTEAGYRRDREFAQSTNAAPSELTAFYRALGKSGLDRSEAVARPGTALFVGFASRPPMPLPGSTESGDCYVIVRKEVPLR